MQHIRIKLSCRFPKFLVTIWTKSDPYLRYIFYLLNFHFSSLVENRNFYKVYSSPKSMIGSSNYSPNVIGGILMLHNQKNNWLWTLQCTPQPKKFLAVEPSICATAKNSFGCGTFSVRHSQNLAVESVRTHVICMLLLPDDYCLDSDLIPRILEIFEF